MRHPIVAVVLALFSAQQHKGAVTQISSAEDGLWII